MTAAALLGLMVNRSLRLRTRMLTQAETHTIGLGDVSSVARVVLVVTLVCERRWRWCSRAAAPVATWPALGRRRLERLFHAVSAFNNAGFALHGDSLMRYAGDAWMLVPVMLGIVIGGIGFPVLQDMRAPAARPAALVAAHQADAGRQRVLLAGVVACLLFEWSNPKTLGPMGLGDKLLSACSRRCRPARRASTRSTSAR
jgi:trk system potassium uptake protein